MGWRFCTVLLLRQTVAMDTVGKTCVASQLSVVNPPGVQSLALMQRGKHADVNASQISTKAVADAEKTTDGHASQSHTPVEVQASSFGDVLYRTVFKEATWIRFVPVLLGLAFMLLVCLSCLKCGFFWSSSIPDNVTNGHLRPWSITGILALTSYRFYTGFLSATWMPFLLAMEGKHLMGERQAVFMGTAKLIYGLSILFNPLFGLLGDQMTVYSRWTGRRLFVVLGVGISGLGIYVCFLAEEIQDVRWYFLGTILWMVGEALADVTTETLVPELLPKSQYGMSSALRGFNFLLGGIAGYSLLIFFKGLHYSWLYYGYLVVMILCASFSLCMMSAEDPADESNEHLPPGRQISVVTLLSKAYLGPARYAGGFPRACFCLFCFSLGSAPIFFLLLMIRDIVGIREEKPLQVHFGFISMTFFVFAALASVLISLRTRAESKGIVGKTLITDRDLQVKFRSMYIAIILFGAVSAWCPAVGLLPTTKQRVLSFYGVSAIFGGLFGIVYCKFQDCVWSILPEGVDVANVMGWAAMCKLAGVGVGNFLAGMVLDLYVADRTSEHKYEFRGYVMVCSLCGMVVFLSATCLHGVLDAATAQGKAEPEPKAVEWKNG